MSKRKFKVIKDFGNPRKSERRKYLETMMADMGLTSLRELSPKERKRWIAAARPQPIVEKKLKEMGYSIHSHTNKRSLGQYRLSELKKFRKVATVSNATARYAEALRLVKSLSEPETVHDIMKILSPGVLKDKNFDSDSLRAEVDDVVARYEENPDIHSFYIDALMDEASLYNSEYLKAVGTYDNLDPVAIETSIRQSGTSTQPESMGLGANIHIRRSSTDRDQIAFIQQKLIDLKYPLETFGQDGKFGIETENAVILFQKQNNLPVTGYIDNETFEKLMGSPQSLSDSLREEYNSSVKLKEGLSNINLSNINISRLAPMTHEYLEMLNQVAEEKGCKVNVSSGQRDEYAQSRAMYNNYKPRGLGSTRAESYFRRLYGNYKTYGPSGSDCMADGKCLEGIIDAYNGDVEGVNSDEEKIIYVAEQYVKHWPPSGHRLGQSLDVSMSARECLIESQHLATVDLLDEENHFHVTVKSLVPGGITPGTIRVFRG